MLTLNRLAAIRAAVVALVVLVAGTSSLPAQTPDAQAKGAVQGQAKGQAQAQQPKPDAPPDESKAPAAAEPAAAPPEAAPTPQTKIELPPDVLEPVHKLSAAIDDAEKAIQHLNAIEDDLRNLRNEAESILADSTSAADDLRPQLAAVRALIDKLGPAPGKDQPPEAPAIAAERARLNGIAAQLDGAIKATELTWARARQLIERITVMRHAMFTKNLLERLHSPLLPQVWRDLSAQLPMLSRRVDYQSADWWRWASARQGELAALFAAALGLFALLRWWCRRVLARHLKKKDEPPSFFERGMSIAWTAPLRVLPVLAAAVLIYVGLDMLDLLYPPWERAAGGVFTSILEISLMTSLIGAVLSPKDPHWRIVSLDDKAAATLTRILYAITVIYSLDAAIAEISRAFLAPLTLTVVQSFAGSILFASLLIWAALTPFTPIPRADAPPEEEGTETLSARAVSRHSPLWLKLSLWVLAIAILAFAALGYVALARFLSQQIVLTGLVAAVVWLLYLAIRAVTREPKRRRLPVADVLETRFGLDETRRGQLARLTEAALTMSLIICAIPVVMLQWGFSGADIRDWFKALMFGMEIGSFRISLARILIGIVLFIALLFTTRLFQHWLRDKALKETRLDSGIIDSIDTVVGYAGIAVSALIAVSYAGFDVTNLAIVAGALSVGIGFGLQSIVNNFVSGLILLIERPIKVGDRIVVGTEQGNVRRISVRATEVETFDKASLIIPNSELITGRVLNWTHRNKMGAVTVKVGVSYACDPEQVVTILKRCAAAHQSVLNTPAPSAALDDFGDSALNFSLRISLADIDSAGSVQSDLRMAILKEFREAGIEIPFRTVDVNLRDLEAVSRAIARTAPEAAGGERPARNGRS